MTCFALAISLSVIITFSIVAASSYMGEESITYAQEQPPENNSMKAPIKHVIVVIQGGRSFDHYFGTYPQANGFPEGLKMPSNPFDDNNSRHIVPYRLESTKTASPLVGERYDKIAYNNGAMDAFVFVNELFGYAWDTVMGYYDFRDLPYYWNLASGYVLADNFFSPTMKSGLTNYLYMYAGDNYGYDRSIIPKDGLEIPKTIFDELENKGIGWKTYVSNYDPNINYTNNMVRTKKVSDAQVIRNPLLAIPRFVDDKALNSHIVGLSQFFDDLKGNNFPNVAYIVAPGLNEQAPSDVKRGQEFVTSLVFALMKSNYWKDSAFIITYANSGGWYDHVPPPQTEKGNSSRDYGFRVPTLIISPYSKEGYVDSTLYDSTSILKFIEYLFGLPHLTYNDENANNLLNAFEFEKAPREPFIPPMVYTQDSSSQSTNPSDYYRSTGSAKLIYVSVFAGILLVGITAYLFNRSQNKSRQSVLIRNNGDE
jgi:phospholipase C